MSEIRRHSWRIDVSDAVPLPGEHSLAVDIVLPAPERLGDAPLALCCLPGGFLSRRYYDMELDGSRTFSFAEHMAHHGLISVAIDHLGVGESSRPDDERGFELDVEAFARANQAALDSVLERLRKGRDTGLPPLPDLRSIGVGHSMGSCLCVVQQALTASHAALVLFSFTTRGMRDALSPEELELADDLEAIRTRSAELARRRFGSPWPQGGGGGATKDAPHLAFQLGTAPPSAGDALRKVSTNVLAIPGLLSMIPGAYAPYADRIEVPVFIATGDHDLHAPHRVPGMFPRSPEAVAYQLEDCWHCHHVANTRTRLWDRVAHWLRGAIPDAPIPNERTAS